ncbi:MAG: helix-turn-helix domain-containing protein [Pseudomonadota bacterium]
MPSAEPELLRQCQKRLLARSATARIAAQFLARCDEMADTAAQIIVLEIPDYSLLLDEKGLRETWEHGRRHARLIAQLLATSTPADLGFVQSLGALRAEQRFPLRHVLHTYRIGHRVTWALLQDCIEKTDAGIEERYAIAAELFEFTLGYTNMISVAAAAAYVERQRQLGNVTGQRTRQFFDALLSGQPLDPDVLTFARASGLESSPLHILIARKQDNAPTTGVEAHLAEALSMSGNRPLCVTLDDMAVSLLPSDVLESLFHKNSESRSRLTALLAAEHMVAGVSGPITLAAQGLAAFREAVFASELATQHNRVVNIGSIALIDVAMTRPDLDLHRLLPDWLDRWQQMPDGSREDLELTLSTFANADMHVKATADALGLHPNTIGFRLKKIRDLTALEPRHYHDLTQIRTVLKIANQ